MNDNTMKSVSAHDREILRRRARLQRHYAESSRNEVILKQWLAQAEGRRDTPPVRLLFSNFRHEVITPRMQCEGEQARELESALFHTLVSPDIFGEFVFPYQQRLVDRLGVCQESDR